MSATDYKQNYFEFGGIDSRSYGIIVSNDNGFESPERDVEEYTVPGRNGTLVMDNGRWHNQILTYNDCVIETGFESEFADFRADVCSKLGYQRIEDSFHPNHFRLGRLEGTIEPKLGTDYNSGYFDVSFNVKPQRYLKSGESQTAVTSGDTVANPTAYPASPLLIATGYGDIVVGGQTISIELAELGVTKLLSDTDIRSSATLDKTLYNTGDTISIGPSLVRMVFKPDPFVSSDTVMGVTLTDTGSTGVTLKNYYRSSTTITCEANLPLMTATAGTSKTTTHTFSVTVAYTSSGVSYQATANVTAVVSYSRAGSSDTLGGAVSATTSGTFPKLLINGYTIKSGNVTVDSSVSANGTQYLDTEVGEAWIINDGEKVSVNRTVTFPDILPTLGSATTITFDNTITALSIIPRWFTI